MSWAHTDQCETRLHHPFCSLAPAHQLPICAVELPCQGADRNRWMSRVAAQALSRPGPPLACGVLGPWPGGHTVVSRMMPTAYAKPRVVRPSRNSVLEP